MRKKKILVHGTLKSLYNFFADAVSRDFEIIGLLSARPKKISIMQNGKALAALTPKNLPKFNYELIDGIIFTGKDKSVADFFLEQGIEPRKIIFYDAESGWQARNTKTEDGTKIIYFYGLEFHLRNQADENTFKRIKNYIQGQWQVKNWSPEHYSEVLKENFQKRRGKSLDFDNLQTFMEKLNWMKVFDATPLKSRLADKYAVRSWVAEKIGAEYLIPLLGVWKDFDDINFDDLPDQFVLKCNHGWNMNIVVRDKKSLDMIGARERINAWLAVDYSATCLELHYTRIDRKIIAEKFMQNGDLPDLIDYKFWCFGGKPTYCKCMTGRTTDLRIDYFDMNWQHMHYEQKNRPNSNHPEEIPPPKNFELMKSLVAKLAEGFPFVRVDFYEIEGRVYFGEMTFTPAAGNIIYKSEGTDEYLGSLLKLPAPTPPPAL